MGALPNFEQAFIDDSKLTEYALNPQNDRGQHKARVFANSLGYHLGNWQELKNAILSALPYHDCTPLAETPFGQKYQVVLSLVGANQQTGQVMTIWQFDRRADGSLHDAPRLVTLYVP